MSNAADLLRLYLSQRCEIGETELVLDGLSAVELLRMVERSRQPPSLRPLPRSPEPAPAGPAHPPAPGAADSALAVPREAASRLVAAPVVQLGDLDAVRATALTCPRCRLAETRKQVVFGEGDESADLMVIGEAPGADEDRTGRPFVGRAGKLLDLLLASVGFPRESVYICNVLKCRPPANRDPEPDEIEACSPYLLRQVELVAPRVILTVGTFPSQTLLASREPINRLRGRMHEYQGVPVVPTYHPAALLRNPGWIRPVWEDLQSLRSLLDADPARV